MPQNKRTKRIKALAMRKNDLAQVNSFDTSKFSPGTMKVYAARKGRIEQEIASLENSLQELATA